MEVPFVDLYRNYQRVSEAVDSNLHEVIESTWFIGGEQVDSFEAEFADYLGSEYGVGVASGTDAIFLALKAAGIGEGDEVITVSHTFVSSVDGIVHAGARPRFVDIDPETYLMDPDAVEEEITDDTAAILPVHLYGQPANLEPLVELADEHDLMLLEDTCQAHGATCQGQRVGTFGDASMFSFYPSKNLGAFGDGGFVATDDRQLAEEIRKLREYGEADKYVHESIAYNSRLDAIQAAVLRAKLPELDDWNAERRAAAAKYDEAFEPLPLSAPTTRDGCESIYHLYVVQTRSESERDSLREYLESNGISCGIHYPVPVHQQPSYEQLPVEMPSLPHTERVASRILSLPMFPEITAAEIDYVVKHVREFYATHAED